MGLAASQARFLAITSRKMNCEFQSMQIAQEKLSITRDLQKAAEDYENGLAATKLVWESSDNDTYDLSYDLMMTPSALNDYDPYLITDSQGKIVLSESMYSAAVNAGVISETGQPTGKMSAGSADSKNDGSRNAFLYQLGVVNAVDSSTVESIKNLGEDGYSLSGVGGEIYSKNSTNALTTTAFISYMKKATYEDYYEINNSLPDGVTDKSELLYSVKLVDALESLNWNYTNSTDTAENTGNTYIVTKNGQGVSQDTLNSLTIGDMLSSQYELTYNGASLQPSGIEKIITSLAKILGYNDGSSTGNATVGLNVDTTSNAALNEAYQFTLAQYNSSSDITYIDDATINTLKDYAQQKNNIVHGNNNLWTVSLSNILRSYLTNFAIAIDGYDVGYSVDDDTDSSTNSAAKSNYVTSDPSYYFILTDDGAVTDQAMLNADFYNMLYNQLCMNGASNDNVKQEMVTDKDYLNNALKNGQLFVSSLSSDGYFYGGAYSLTGKVTEVTDEDAIARAEAEYNVTKSKLNYKEETLELQMKNLDTEISALTTEFDTVKSLISKNVEKVFTMFSS